MTTKKQRRAKVAEKRARYDEETRRMGLAAQQLDHEKKQQKAFEALREKNKKANAEAMKSIAS